MDAHRIRAWLAAIEREEVEVSADATRHWSGPAEVAGADVVAVERFGPVWILSTDGQAEVEPWKVAVGRAGCRSLWVRPLEKHDKGAPYLLAGDDIAATVVDEDGLRFEVRPGAGYSCGLFLDQRNNRRALRRRARAGDRVLNLFAYTCSFSVAAAASKNVATSVDLHQAYLDWGRRNFAHNGIDAKAHFWIKGDAFDWLAAFARKGRRFDGVVVDPPTFSRGTKQKVFRVEKDYAALVALAARVVAPGGWLLLCANTHRQGRRAFAEQVDDGLRAAGICFERRSWEPMPDDFAGDDYLKSLWLDGRR